MRALSGVWRVVLWDFERGGLAYDLLILLIAAVVFLVPESVWHDPLRRPTR